MGDSKSKIGVFLTLKTWGPVLLLGVGLLAAGYGWAVLNGRNEFEIKELRMEFHDKELNRTIDSLRAEIKKCCPVA